MPTIAAHHPSGRPAVTAGHDSTGHPVAAEPHPWGDPPPAGHPGYQPPGQLDVGAFARWFIYATVLAVTTIVITLIALAATLDTPNDAPTPMIMPLNHTTATVTPPGPDNGSSSSDGDRFVQTEGDASRYHGPAPAPVIAGSLLAQGSGTGR